MSLPLPSREDLELQSASLQAKLDTAFISRLLEEGIFEFENLSPADFVSGKKLPVFRPTHKNQHFALTDIALLTGPIAELFLSALPSHPDVLNPLSEKLYLSIKSASTQESANLSQVVRLLVALLSPAFVSSLIDDGILPRLYNQDPYIANSRLRMHPHTKSELAELVKNHIPPLYSSKTALPSALLA